VFVYADLDPAPEQGPLAYAIGPAGAQPLPFVDNIRLGFAGWTSPDGAETRLAWDEYAVADDNSLVSHIWSSGLDGANRQVLLEHRAEFEVLQVLDWTPDGSSLLFSIEPVGLGGYIPFAGISNLWARAWSDGTTSVLVRAEEVGTICLADVYLDPRQVAHHCAQGSIGVIDVTGRTTPILPPPELAGQFNLLGDARFSPDGSRLAFALARGNPEAEQGWVAVAPVTVDGVPTAARLALTAPEGALYNIAGWLSADTLVLQTAGVVPGVWLANVDTGEAKQVAEAFVLEVLR
jgi:hypothetical protein